LYYPLPWTWFWASLLHPIMFESPLGLGKCYFLTCWHIEMHVFSFLICSNFNLMIIYLNKSINISEMVILFQNSE
jgi:hypothetical protein